VSQPTSGAPSSTAPCAPYDAPRRGSAFLQNVGRTALRLAGWRIVGDVPRLPKFVLVVAPHTSNWDFFVGVAAMFALDLRANWLGKASLFIEPMGSVLRWLGGRPVRRDSPEGVVGDVAALVRSSPQFILALAPEGTRKRVDQWRTGFYRIAEATGMPIVPVWFDWSRREIGLGAPLAPTGDMSSDLATLQRNYRAEMGRYPENF
jgi:1-acyl-sn-glycerol-3-phosphate acyltransferase